VVAAAALVALLVVAVVLFFFGAPATIVFGAGMLVLAALSGVWAIWFTRRGRSHVAR
jgi:hypothetical protein